MAESSKIRSVYEQPEASFSAGPSPSTGSSMRFIHAREIAPAPDAGESIPLDFQNDTVDDPGVAIGAPGGTIAFGAYARGPGAAAAATDGVAATDGEVGRLLRAAFGDAHYPEGSTFDAGWTTTSGDVADASTWAVGDIFYRTAASGKMEARYISAIAGDTVTFAPAFSAAPATSAEVRAMANYLGSNSGQQSVALALKGANWTHLFKGCASSSPP